jgi:hypothetical protein
MSQEDDPVEKGEYVLRRIHKDHYNAALTSPVLRLAFQPSKWDTDGLSVCREQFISAAQLAALGRASGAYYVARLAVVTLHGLSLTVIPSPRDDLPGHAVIPELSLSAYRQEKKRLDAVQVELARLASLAIIHEPNP